MAGKSPNLKINVTADSSGVARGVRESKTAIKDFESVATGAVSKIGQAFGVNTSEISKLTNAFQGMGAKMASSSKAGVAAMGNLVTSVSAVGAGVAAIGIGGLVAGFKLLTEEANAFKATVQGANIELQTAAYVDTYRQVMHDMREGVGKNFAEFGADMKEGFTRGWENVKAATFNIIDNVRNRGSKNISQAIDAGIADTKRQAEEANALGVEAKKIADETFRIERQLSDKSVEWAQTEADIANYKRIAYDKTKDTAERQQAILKAQELTKARFQEEADLRAKLAQLASDMNDLASSTPEQIDHANQLRKESLNVTVGMNNALREMSEMSKSIADQAKKEADEREESARHTKEMADLRRFNTDHAISEVTPSFQLPTKVETPEGMSLAIPVEIDEESVQQSVLDLQSMISGGVESLSASIGTLIGDLATGGDAWANFGNTALKSFGDMAVQIGKMAIATGVASLGIKEALKLHPWAAIAAGAALVALGAAVSAGMSNIASGAGGGGYAPMASVASSGYAPSSQPGGGVQSLDINLTGTFKASGNSLVSVLNNENVNKQHTT